MAPELRRNAATLVYNVGQLGLDMDAAIGVLADIDKLEDLAFNALDTYPRWSARRRTATRSVTIRRR